MAHRRATSSPEPPSLTPPFSLLPPSTTAGLVPPRPPTSLGSFFQQRISRIWRTLCCSGSSPRSSRFRHFERVRSGAGSGRPCPRPGRRRLR